MKKKKTKPKNIKPLGLKSTFFTMAITCFPEHIPKGEEALYDAIRSVPPEEYQVIAIKHYKSSDKPHYHILFKIPDGKKRKEVNPRLKMLGIAFRPGIDDDFIKNRGLETCGSFPAYATYLMHKTTEAIQEGKASYDKSDYITNLTADELQQVLDGYTITKRQLTPKGQAYTIDAMRQAGYDLKPYAQTLASFNILGLSATHEGKLQKAYISGVKDRYGTDNRLTRITLEVEYPQDASLDEITRINTALREAFSGYRCSCTKTNVLENLDIFTDVIIVYDIQKLSYGGYATEMVDALSAHKIVSVDSYALKKCLWRGKYLVFTHEYIPRTVSKPKKRENPNYFDKTEYEIVHQNYILNDNSFFCSVKENQLFFLKQPALKLSQKEGEQLQEDLKKIRDNFNLAMVTEQQQPSSSFRFNLDELNS